MDAAVVVFWREGYKGADTASLAAAMGLTKPSVYSAFGDKRDLFMKVLQRYRETAGSEAMMAFDAAGTIEDAVADFLLNTCDDPVRRKRRARMPDRLCCCSMCETMEDVRDLLADTLRKSEEHLTARFACASQSGSLPPGFPCERRAALMVDLMQASAVRARSGATLKELTRLAGDNAATVLGP